MEKPYFTIDKTPYRFSTISWPVTLLQTVKWNGNLRNPTQQSAEVLSVLYAPFIPVSLL